MPNRPPFIILALPRSRTAWLSRFLDCGHDLVIDCDSIACFVESLGQNRGTVETAAVEGWPLLRSVVPQVRIVVIRRSTDEVLRSLSRWVPMTGEIKAQIELRARLLDFMSAQSGVIAIQYDKLASEDVCAWLFEYCVGLQHDPKRWQALHDTNLQIDMTKRLEKLSRNADRIAKLRAEVGTFDASPMAYTVTREPFAGMWPEINDVAAEHFEEVDGGVEPRRQMKIDYRQLTYASRVGAFHCFMARKAGKLVGYFTWTVARDPESEGLLTGTQGAWFVEPGVPARVSKRLWDRSVSDLKAMGVQCLYPHHRLQGRGAHLGRFFERQRAKPIKTEYSLWIGA